MVSFVPAASVGPTLLKVRSSAGAWLSGTVRYMAGTPVSMRRLPHPAGVAPLTEMQAGAPAQSRSSGAPARLIEARSPRVLAPAQRMGNPLRVTPEPAR